MVSPHVSTRQQQLQVSDSPGFVYARPSGAQAGQRGYQRMFLLQFRRGVQYAQTRNRSTNSPHPGYHDRYPCTEPSKMDGSAREEGNADDRPAGLPAEGGNQNQSACYCNQSLRDPES